MSQLAPKTRELEHQPYSVCVRNTVTYECLSYAADGSVRRMPPEPAVAEIELFAPLKPPSLAATLGRPPALAK